MYASTSLLGGSSSAVRREVLGNSLTQWSDERISNHWRRNKRASIDLLELPVAVDRQLEDQRLIMARNRNPQLDVPTKVDKVRSEQIIAKIGATRAVAVKAAVLNKIVREATGINTYVITAPPRSGEDKPEDISDPDTNPHFKSYAKETKKKPQIVSFGHRPRSASRTFNPATMRIRMRHGEMANPGRDGQYGFGLPVGILAKILKAPKITNADPFKTRSARNTPDGDQDVYDLFSLPGGGDEEEDFYEKEPVVGGGAFDSASELQESSLGMESWVSPTQQSLQMGKVRGGGVRKGQFSKAAGEPLTGNRRGRNPGNPTTTATATDGDNATVNSQYYNKDLHPLPWDSAHHNVRLSHHELYDIKKNVMPNQNYSLTERMTRFSQKTIADEITPFCKEKQQLDMQILRAGPSAPPPNFDVSPPKGQPRFHDPNNLNLGYVIKRREELLQNMDRKKRSHNFQADLMTVPEVQYHPQSLNMQIQSGALALKDILQSVASIPPKEWEDFQPPSKLDRFLHEKSNTYQSALALKTNSLNALSLSKPPAFDQKSYRPAHGSSVTSQLVPSPSTSPVLGIGGVVSDAEANLYLAMRRAKKGDKRALYHHFHTPEHRVEAQEKSQLEQWHQESEEILATRAIDSIPLKEQQEQAEASVEALLQMAAENKARERAATAEARARREEELEQARLIEEQRRAEAALLEIQQAAARQKAADEAAAERQRVEQLKREREAAERAEAEARRSAAPTPQPPKPMISLTFASMRAWDLVNTGSAFDAQDPALRLFLEPGAKLIGKTLRQKDAGIQASFPESFSVDVFLDDYVAGSLELRAEVVSQDATGLINKHVGVGSVRMFSIFGQGLPQYQGEKIPVKATVTINLSNTNKGIEKGHVELTCGVQVPIPDYKVGEEILQDPVFVAPSGLGLVCEENGRELERAQGQEQEQ